jgi:hypothetical protein
MEDAGTDVGDTFTRLDEDFDTTAISEEAAGRPECTGLF